MNKIVSNILNVFKGIKKDVFTKTEIEEIIKDSCWNNKQPIVESNGVVINPETSLVYFDGKDHYIPKKEFDLLYYLIVNKNTPISRDKILKEVWGNDVLVGERTIDVHIRRIRSILPSKFIETNKGFGYRWIEKNN